MKKFCVFCGRSPEAKNKEHVLPQWLIRMTGDSKRLATFGVNFTRRPFSVRQFSFDALTFPACFKCNSHFSELETTTEPIVRKLLAHQAVTARDLILLLDWLDKVRLGLWLGYLYLDGNPLGIVPSYYIQNRVGQRDRMVAIIEIEEPSAGLSFFGPEFKTYQLSPTCLGLRINGFCFVNASGISLCSRRLGFPYAEPIRFRDDQLLDVSFHRGIGRIMSPVERSTSLASVTSIYQPIFRLLLDSVSAAGYAETEWVHGHAADFERGYGQPFLQRDGLVQVYPNSASTGWIPPTPWEKWEMVKQVSEYVLSRLSKDFQKGIAISSSPELRKEMRRQAAMTRMVDSAILRKISESAVRMRGNV